MSIILQIDNIFVDIVGELPDKNKKELERKLSFRPANYQFSTHFNRYIYDKEGQKTRRFWDGWKRQFWSGKKRTYFPTGLLSLVVEYFNENGISYTTQNLRVRPEKTLQLEDSGVFTLRDYQKKVVDDARERQRGIIQLPTGAGKTIISAAIIKELGVSPFLFFVTSIDLLTQAKQSIESALMLGGSKLQVGQLGGGIIDIRDINVCTIQTIVRAFGQKWDKNTKFDSDDADDKTPIEKYKDEICELVRSAKGAIGDEIQHWRAETCQIVARELKSAYFTYGQSATPYRDEGDDMMIQACFGKKIAVVTASELIQKDWLVRPEIKIVHIKDRKSQFKQWQSIYKDRIVDCEQYNAIVANIANSYIDAGRSVLVLFQQINHGKMLSEIIKGSQFLSGSSPKKQREEGLNNLRNRYIRCIVASIIFDEGIDVQSLDCVLLAGGGKSRVRAMQRIGRITRPYTYPDGTKKTKATAIDFCIHDKYLLQHAREREKMYRTEPEYQIEHINDN